MSTLTNTFRGKNLSAIDCSAVIVAHGRFPEYNGPNFVFTVPENVNVFFYATPGKLLHDASWIAGGSLCFIPENTLASAICRSVYENDLRYSLTYIKGDLVPDLDIITDGYQEGDPDYDKFVSGIKVCSRPFTIPFGHFSSYGLTPSGHVQSGSLKGHNVYKLSAIIQFCIKYRRGLFPGCTDNNINIHVATCMENFPHQDSVRLYAQRVIQYTTAKTGSPPGYTDNELVDYLQRRSTDIVHQTNPAIREKQTYKTVQRAQGYDKYILDMYKEENDDFMKKARKYYNTRLQQDRIQYPYGTPSQTTQQGTGAVNDARREAKLAARHEARREARREAKDAAKDDAKDDGGGDVQLSLPPMLPRDPNVSVFFEENKTETEEAAREVVDRGTSLHNTFVGLREGNIVKIQNTRYMDGALRLQLNALSIECFQQPYKERSNEILYAIVDNSGNIILSFLSVYVENVQNGYYSIWNVCTGSQFRRQGLMRSLLTRVMQDLVEMGAVEIKLTVVHNNPPRDRLMNMYRAYGFQVSGWTPRNMIMTWWKDDLDDLDDL